MFNEHGVCPMLSLTLFKIFPSKYIWHVLDCLRDLIHPSFITPKQQNIKTHKIKAQSNTNQNIKL